MFQTLTFIEGCAGDSGGPLVLNGRDVSANQDGDFIVAIFILHMNFNIQMISKKKYEKEKRV